MKIHAFHGNPPYQDINKRSKLRGANVALWKQAIDIVRRINPDMIYFITPTNMFNGTKKDRIEFDFNQQNLVGGTPLIASVHFDTDDQFVDEFGNSISVGVSTCRWMILKTQNPLIIKINGKEYNRNELRIIHKNNEISSLLNKIFNHSKEMKKLKFSSSGGYSSSDIFSEQNMRYKYPIDVNGKLKFATSCNSQIGKHLIIAPRISTTGIYYATDRMTEGSSYTMEVDSKSDAKSLLSLLRTSLYVFIFNATKIGGRLSRTYMNMMPLLDLTEDWNDDKIKNIFQLTPEDEEILKKPLASRLIIKSKSKKDKSRLDKTGEIFTSPTIIKRMFEEYPKHLWSPESVICDPTCGNGNFLIETIRRKIELGHSKCQAVQTTLGVDIMLDNIQECRSRVLAEIGNTDKHRKIINSTIVCADALFGFDFNLFKEIPFHQPFTADLSLLIS